MCLTGSAFTFAMTIIIIIIFFLKRRWVKNYLGPRTGTLVPVTLGHGTLSIRTLKLGPWDMGP